MSAHVHRPTACTRLVAVGVLVATAVLGPLGLTAAGATPSGQRVDLQVLVVANGDPSTAAIAAQLDRTGVPYTQVSADPTARPAIDDAFLTDPATGAARFQAVVLPTQGALAGSEATALSTYERAYGIRQVNAYNYPGASLGLNAPNYTGPLDGAPATVTDAGRAGGFGYLNGSFAIDDVDPAVDEVYGYLAPPLDPLPAGATFTPLITAQKSGSTGVLAGVYSRDGRDELELQAPFNSSMQWFNEVVPGIVDWMTRGIHLGYQRNYFAVNVDDVFLPDSRWSISGNCTPGDDCVDKTLTTPDIRMTAADVDRLAAWQQTSGAHLDMTFNGGGSEQWRTDHGGSDPLTDEFLAKQAQFPWLNHTYTHPYLGCIQIAPTVLGQPWTCATAPDQTPRQDPDVPEQLSNGIYWASQNYISDQVRQNIAWANKSGLTHFDPTELVTGEHSGLATAPQQPADNPFLAPALAGAGITTLASDASREPAPRQLSATTTTLPRHPMNIYYNAATYQEQMNEYNWYYTSRANGGSGICEDHPTTTTCITALDASSEAAAQASFTAYLQPMEVRNALRDVLGNDPRPFYAHQSNLAETGTLYPVLDGILNGYRSVYAASAPVVQLDLNGQSQVLSRMSAWRGVASSTSAYLDSTGVHVSAGGALAPLTMPAGTTGAALAPYAGSLSGWVSGQVTAVPPSPYGGYVGTLTTSPAPLIGTATPGNVSAAVSWTAPTSTGGSPVTSYLVRAYPADGSAPTSVSAGPTDTTASVPDLVSGMSYTLDVSAVNAGGTGPASARSNAVTPVPPLRAPGAPTIGTATAGPAAATVTWTAPADNGGSAITGYQIRVYANGATTPSQTVQEAASATSATVSGLTNGTAYAFDVVAVNAVGPGAGSAVSNSVTPLAVATTPAAPTLAGVNPGNAMLRVTWQAPASDGGSAVTGYRVRVYSGSTLVKTASFGVATAGSISGLTNGTAYTVDVAAVNAVGKGPASGRSAPVTPAVSTTVPTAPPTIGAAAGVASATVTWSAPANAATSGISGYSIRVYDGTTATLLSTVAAGPTVRSLLVGGLTNGRTYTFTVSATGGLGTSPESTRSPSVTPRAKVPAAPVIGTATGGAPGAPVTATAAWTAPTSDGGSAITGYRVTAALLNADGTVASRTTATVGPTVLQYVMTLKTAGSYSFKVLAVNGAGSSPSSAASNVVAAQ